MKKVGKKILSLFLIIVFILSSIYAIAIADDQSQEFYRAVHMGGNWGCVDCMEKLPDEYFEYLQSIYVEWVGISVALHYDDAMDSTVERKYSGDIIQTFEDEFLSEMIEKFHSYGFKIYLTIAFESTTENMEHPIERWQLGDPNYPILEDLSIDENYWPWCIDHPNHDSFIAEFWQTYTEQAVHFAQIAEDEGVEMFSVGTETERLFRTRSGGNWPNDFKNELLNMVSSVREVFSGLLTYDMHYDAIGDGNEFYGPGSDYLWEDINLDVVGISAYFPLTDSIPTTVMTVDELETEWRKIFENYLTPLKNRNPGKPILFLEYGYTDSIESPYRPASNEFETKTFLDNDSNVKDDGEETQANIHQAFFNVLNENPDILKGAFFWGTMMMGHDDWNNSFGQMRGFCVRDNLAESVVSAQYEMWKLMDDQDTTDDTTDDQDTTDDTTDGQDTSDDPTDEQSDTVDNIDRSDSSSGGGGCFISTLID